LSFFRKILDEFLLPCISTVGWPEIAVIGAVVALVFGPSNIAGLGKDLGKLAGSLKKEVWKQNTWSCMFSKFA
jgi:TatA/E family protein of Tat protein translocase